jgi:hypothetical protein
MARDLQRVRGVVVAPEAEELDAFFRDVPREIVVRHVYEAPVAREPDLWAEPVRSDRWPYPMRLVAYVFALALAILGLVLVVQSGLLDVSLADPPWKR